MSLQDRIARPLPEHLAPFYFRKRPEGVLLTNDWGFFAWLSEADFDRFLAGPPAEGAPWDELRDKAFVRTHLDFQDLAHRWARRSAYLWSGARLHIAVLTTRCNYGCVYCQTASSGRAEAGEDMTPEVARRLVEFVFRSPAPELTIEFQGGEPLMNWPALEYIVRYGRDFAANAGRKLRFALVSNLSLMTEERLAFLAANDVGLCTSLDGPAELHDANRPFTGGSSHAVVERWLMLAAEAYRDTPERRRPRPGALLTVTRRSLACPEKIADEYTRLGLPGLFARPLQPFGTARRAWPVIGYSPAEFLGFYGRLLDRVLELDRSGARLREWGASIVLAKILRGTDPGYTDLRSPCGAATGQLAYNPDGDVYTCDEGRMLGSQGDPLFRLGNVMETDYEAAVHHATAKACAVASTLEAQPACSTCAYKPFCGVCPVYNYAAQGTIWGRMPTNDRCAIWTGLFDAVFSRLRDPAVAAVFERWAACSNPRCDAAPESAD